VDAAVLDRLIAIFRMANPQVPGEAVLEDVLRKYQIERDSLLKQESAWENDINTSLEGFPAFAEAESIVHEMKLRELAQFYGQNTKESLHLNQFMHAKDVIRHSPLAKLMELMPKGSLLHCHLEAMLSPAGLIELAREKENLCICTNRPLLQLQDFEGSLAFPRVGVFPDVNDPEILSTNIFSKDYKAGTWMQYRRFLNEWPSGGLPNAEAWLLSKIVLGASDVYDPSQSINGIWEIFIQSFQIVRGFIYYETAWRHLWKSTLNGLIKENIQYAEIRFVLSKENTVLNDDGTRNLSYDEMLHIVEECIVEEKERCNSENIVFHGIRIIYTMLRKCPTEDMEWAMDNCIALKEKFPDLICGEFSFLRSLAT
jgi:adenosine deaminase CECR1